MGKTCRLIVFMALMVCTAPSVQAATAFANPQFEAAWRAGEAIAPNFWGPLANASDVHTQDYKEAAGGNRLVQYFDKGRMELTNGQVTFGLLAKEMISGQVQEGDNTFVRFPLSTIPVAGDKNGKGPSFETLYIKRDRISLGPVTFTGGFVRQTGQAISITYNPDTVTFEIPDRHPAGPNERALTSYDDATKHNVMDAFGAYRDTAGLSTIGLAVTEPFTATFTVGGVDRTLIVQVFERRVLTYNGNNPDAFKVEMGNIGQQYFQWRNGTP